jgi:hypothetical protein
LTTVIHKLATIDPDGGKDTELTMPAPEHVTDEPCARRGRHCTGDRTGRRLGLRRRSEKKLNESFSRPNVARLHSDPVDHWSRIKCGATKHTPGDQGVVVVPVADRDLAPANSRGDVDWARYIISAG